MNCREFKKNSLLFIDNELTEEIKSSIQDHLFSCEACSTYLNRINSIYSQTQSFSMHQKADQYFYTRLRARMESEKFNPIAAFRQISYYLKPAFYTLLAFTLFLSFLVISSNIKIKQKANNSVTVQTNNSEEQIYLSTVAMNDATLEDDYLKIIDK
jgi:hypothetical protein